MEPNEPIKQLTSWLVKIEARFSLFGWSSWAELGRDYEQAELTHEPLDFSTSLAKRGQWREMGVRPEGKDEDDFFFVKDEDELIRLRIRETG